MQPVTFSLEIWAKSLDLGPEPEAGNYVNLVCLGTISRVLQSALSTRPDLKDPALFDREEI